MTLEVKGLRYAYKKHEVLKGVSFSANTNECVCVLGENGAGKTTLFRCILGLLYGCDGEILVDGVKANRLSIKEIAQKIAYIPQAHMPTFNYSVFETVLMGTNVLMKRLNTPGKAERDIAFQMLDLLHISHLAHRGYAELSGGERQLVLIARALAQKSNILIMDEPTANLDYGNQFRAMHQIRQLAAQGYLVILSTHNPEYALHYADKVLILNKGKSELFGTPESVMSPAVIQNIYGVSVELQTVRTQKANVPMFVPCFSRESAESPVFQER